MEVEMKERPILFSPEMVRAVLDDTKTMTRRVVKPQPSVIFNMVFGKPKPINDNGEYCASFDGQEKIIRCPYGQQGDRLWVKEAWMLIGCGQEECCDGRLYAYKADGTYHPTPGFSGWRHGRYMPQIVSRLTLEICEIRVERLQEITSRDIEREGIRFNDGWPHAHREANLRILFRELWDSLHSKDGFDWNANPWVWVVSFRRIDT